MALNMEYNVDVAAKKTTGLTVASLEAYARDKLGYNLDEALLKAQQDALSAPNTYLDNRHKKIKDLDNTVAKNFKALHTNLKTLNVGDETARQYALKQCHAEHDQGMMLINLQYPETFENTAKERLEKI